MRLKTVCLILMIFVFENGTAQLSPQEKYLKGSPSKENFDNNYWKQVKKSMLREARGNAKEENERFEKQDYEVNLQESSYYDYQEEDFEGEYAKNNGEYLDDIDYDDYVREKGTSNYNEKKSNYFSKSKAKSKRKWELNTGSNKVEKKGLSVFSAIVLYVLLAVLLGYLIYEFFLKVSFSDKGKTIVSEVLDVAPVEISKLELTEMLEKALKHEDYRLAIRIYFIFILKELTLKKWIFWKKEKTNSTYLLEMKNRKQYDLFNESVSIFELFWYGNYKIEEADYIVVEHKMKQLLKELESHS